MRLNGESYPLYQYGLINSQTRGISENQLFAPTAKQLAEVRVQNTVPSTGAVAGAVEAWAGTDMAHSSPDRPTLVRRRYRHHPHR
ncbi:hypothetical protein [Streptomyces sp. NBC_01363]|uniref:hypothetical protein n=1 Tax=Streptomyces sp. NBC_01363 TaxID=2903840 RepID=UPI002258FC7E|nr:hypothetical protein [Streptomyces sp. NBC_01363]MCX4736661.1 hypothetical protein [Streptomyces sp. NBC_01363]